MDLRAILEVKLTGPGNEVDTGSERRRHKNYSFKNSGKPTIPFYSVFGLLSLHTVSLRFFLFVSFQRVKKKILIGKKKHTFQLCVSKRNTIQLHMVIEYDLFIIHFLFDFSFLFSRVSKCFICR